MYFSHKTTAHKRLRSRAMRRALGFNVSSPQRPNPDCFANLLSVALARLFPAQQHVAERLRLPRTSVRTNNVCSFIRTSVCQFSKDTTHPGPSVPCVTHRRRAPHLQFSLARTHIRCTMPLLSALSLQPCTPTITLANTAASACPGASNLMCTTVFLQSILC